MYVSWRTNRHDDGGWSVPLNLGTTINTAGGEVGPAYVEDEAGVTVLYFTGNRGQGADIFRILSVSTRRLCAATRTATAKSIPASSLRLPLFSELNSPAGDARPAGPARRT